MNNIDNYYLTVLNEYLLMSDDIDSILKEKKMLLLSEDYVINLFLKMTDLSKEQYYPKKSVKNIEKIIDFLNENNNKSPYLNGIKFMLLKIKNLNSTGNIYYYDFVLKFANIENAKNIIDLKPYEIMIKKSIINDYLLLDDLINSKEIKNTKYNIYSIKKYLKEMPDIFLNRDIFDKALNILENDSNKIEAEILIYKLKNLRHYSDIFFDYTIFKSFYDYVFTQNLIIDRDFIKKEKDLINEDIIKNIYYFIDNKFIYDENIKRNILDVMSIYRDKIINDPDVREKLGEFNDHIGKINLLDRYSNTMLFSEIAVRKSNFRIIKDIDKLLKYDLYLLNLYLSDEELYLKNKSLVNPKYIKSSINKFLYIAPSIFDDETIYERTMDLLNDIYLKNKIKRMTMRR